MKIKDKSKQYMKTRMLSYFFAKQKHGAQPGGSVPGPVEVLHNTSQVKCYRNTWQVLP